MASNIRSPSPTGSTRSSAPRTTPRSTELRYDNDTDDKKDSVKVDHFHGHRDKLSAFLIQLKMVFKLKPTKYANNEDKVMFAAMHLKGPAFSWFEPTMKDWVDNSGTPDRDTQLCFSRFAEFENRIKKVFGTVLESRAAARAIYNIKQKGSAASYFSEFHQVATKLRWEDEDAFAEIFYNGLKREVRQEMMDPPTKYKTMVDEAIKIDNRLFELKVENGAQNRMAHYQGARGHYFRPKNDGYGDPMDLDLMHHRGSPSMARGSGNRGRGGYHGEGRDKERQRKENLCFSCGRPGHRARECKNNAQGLHMMSDGTAGSGEIKADTPDETPRATDSWGRTAQKGHSTSEIHGGSSASTGEEKIPPSQATTALAEACQRTVSFAEPVGKRTPTSRDILEAMRKQQEITDHASKSWVGCYEDSCTIHYSDKIGSGWFPSRPKRKNRKSKQSRECQETLAEQGDLPPHGKNPVDDSFWVMDSQKTEVTKLVVTKMAKDYLYMVTPYWKWVDCGKTDCLQRLVVGHQHGAFDPAVEPCEPREIRVDFCRQPDCPVKGLHAHQGPNDGDTIPIEVPDELSHHVGQEPTQSLSIISDTSSEEETESEEEEPAIIPLASGEDQENRKLTVLRYTPYEMTVITNRWYKKDCKETKCTTSTQHQHLVFDPRMEPQRYLKKIKFHYCTNPSCEEKENVHVHQWGDDDPITIGNPPEQLYKILERRRQGNSINMMVESLGTLETTVDNRANEEHISEYFACMDIGCSEYFTSHAHLFNIDPAYPHIPIRQEAYDQMLKQGMICERQKCRWRLDLHAHFPTQEFNMMVGDKYNPEIVEKVVDERIHEEYVADYFKCADERCPYQAKLHTHLHNVDPDVQVIPLRQTIHGRVLTPCEDDECTWDEWPHLHLPKNL